LDYGSYSIVICQHSGGTKVYGSTVASCGMEWQWPIGGPPNATKAATTISGWRYSRPLFDGVEWWIQGWVRERPNIPQEQVVMPTFRTGSWVPFGAPSEMDFLHKRVDPMSNPPGAPMVAPWVLPYEFLPKRDLNPARAPLEQPDRGNRVPNRPGAMPLPGDEDHPDTERRRRRRERPRFPEPKPDTAPNTVPWGTPDQDPTPAIPWPSVDPRPVRPGSPAPVAPGLPGIAPGESLPGWWAQPQPPPVVIVDPVIHQPGDPDVVRPGDPVLPDTGGPVVGVATGTSGMVRTEFPAGAAGATIIIGGGPGIGTHSRTRVRQGTKERKAKWKSPASSLVVRKIADPMGEALEALDCVWGALPKDLRWKIQKADWNRQRREAAARGEVLATRSRMINPGGPAQVDLGFLGLDGQKMSIPGTARPRPQYADLSKSYIQPLSPQAKAEAVYRHFGKVDLDAAIKCIGADQLEDMAFGQLGKALGDASRRLNLRVGIQTGNVF
jgi:hypothetical protein